MSPEAITLREPEPITLLEIEVWLGVGGAGTQVSGGFPGIWAGRMEVSLSSRQVGGVPGAWGVFEGVPDIWVGGIGGLQGLGLMSPPPPPPPQGEQDLPEVTARELALLAQLEDEALLPPPLPPGECRFGVGGSRDQGFPFYLA